MDSLNKDILLSLDDHLPMMIEQLHQFCQINSGSYHYSGLELVLETLVTAFKPLGGEVTIHSFAPITTFNMSGELVSQRCGNALFIQKRPACQARVLLAGHMDTVYSAKHPLQQLTYINSNKLNGPGVADMKGGLIVMLHALLAFEQTPFAQLMGWDILINADEEIGSPASSALLNTISHHYQAALLYEPAMDNQGTLAKHRKGSGKFTLIATGKAAHAGRAFDEGRNAICYLAQAIIAIHALNGKKEGITINVGKVAGGSALNVVPDKAVVKLDVRITQPQDEQWVLKELQRIITELEHSDYRLTLHGAFSRPVKQVQTGTHRLFHRIKALGPTLGLSLNWQDSGGCCDGNNLAINGLPVIDTLGVRGGLIHSPEEYILLDSLVERAKLSTLLLIDLATGGLKELHV